MTKCPKCKKKFHSPPGFRTCPHCGHKHEIVSPYHEHPSAFINRLLTDVEVEKGVKNGKKK